MRLVGFMDHWVNPDAVSVIIPWRVEGQLKTRIYLTGGVPSIIVPFTPEEVSSALAEVTKSDDCDD